MQAPFTILMFDIMNVKGAQMPDHQIYLIIGIKCDNSYSSNNILYTLRKLRMII